MVSTNILAKYSNMYRGACLRARLHGEVGAAELGVRLLQQRDPELGLIEFSTSLAPLYSLCTAY